MTYEEREAERDEAMARCHACLYSDPTDFEQCEAVGCADRYTIYAG